MQQTIITADTADQVASRSEELFRQGLFCAESVLQAVAPSPGHLGCRHQSGSDGPCVVRRRYPSGGAAVGCQLLCHRQAARYTCGRDLGNHLAYDGFIFRYNHGGTGPDESGLIQ